MQLPLQIQEPGDVTDYNERRPLSVRVEPSGALIEVEPGETLMGAAERQGYRWPTVCHGQAICTACCIVLDDNADDFEPSEPVEVRGLELLEGRSFYEGKVVRLACQARPRADTVVIKRGVRKLVSGSESAEHAVEVVDSVSDG